MAGRLLGSVNDVSLREFPHFSGMFGRPDGLPTKSKFKDQYSCKRPGHHEKQSVLMFYFNFVWCRTGQRRVGESLDHGDVEAALADVRIS